jgi:hypothetical protein
MNVIMGRDVKLPFAALALGHFAVALVYMAVVAQIIYRFRVVMGIVAGLGVTLALYAVNFVVFRMSGMEQQSPEFRTFLVHVTFGIMASAIYKALSVPKPLRGSTERAAV